MERKKGPGIVPGPFSFPWLPRFVRLPVLKRCPQRIHGDEIGIDHIAGYRDRPLRPPHRGETDGEAVPTRSQQFVGHARAEGLVRRAAFSALARLRIPDYARVPERMA